MMNQLKTFAVALLAIIAVLNLNGQQAGSEITRVRGQMPSVTKDKAGTIHMAYGIRDSLFYMQSANGKLFSAPEFIAAIPGVFTTAMRGPQIALAANGIVVTACTKKGDIYAIRKQQRRWTTPVRLNEQPEGGKEGLMALAADGPNVFAIWLNEKSPKGQALYGIRSRDGGLTWGKNMVVYDSPDKSICECCKPSIEMKGNDVYIMFRNWLAGNRDMYVLHSANGGSDFAPAVKQGTGHWQLNACPMDGGALAINDFRKPATIWQRAGKIYTTSDRSPELLLGEGRNGSIEVLRANTVYAWSNNGTILLKKNTEPVMIMGKGTQPVVRAVGQNSVLCVWQSGTQLEMRVVQL